MSEPKPVPEDKPYNRTAYLKKMIAAVDAVISGAMSQREAAKAFNIHRRTLRLHLPKHETYKHNVAKKAKPASNSARGKAIFTKKEEKQLVEYILNMYRSGFGRTVQDIKTKMQDALNKAERKTKFENNMPDNEWFSGFLERHKDSIKECIVNERTGERGIMPLDDEGMSQAIEETIESVVASNVVQTPQPQQIIIHQQPAQPIQQQQQQQQQQVQRQVVTQSYHIQQPTQHNLATHPSLQHLQVQAHPTGHITNIQEQVGLGGHTLFVHRATATPETAVRSRTITYPFQL